MRDKKKAANTCQDCTEAAAINEGYSMDGEILCAGCFEEAVHFACMATVSLAAVSETTRQEAAAGGVA
jgi:hypothetical protein